MFIAYGTSIHVLHNYVGPETGFYKPNLVKLKQSGQLLSIACQI